jgi:hypothetical protein
MVLQAWAATEEDYVASDRGEDGNMPRQKDQVEQDFKPEELSKGIRDPQGPDRRDSFFQK